ncbi:MAG: hypothetical protein HXY40_18840 [Chloroflexi bacterium]|nr:hypothetical protein [Chloroflexota bacterium]
MKEEPIVETLAESENFSVYVEEDPEDGPIYHLDLARLTLHLLPEEWDELVLLVRVASKKGK